MRSCFRGGIDYFITCGGTEALYNNRMLKKIGFEVTDLVNISPATLKWLPSPIRVIKRMSDEKIIGRLIEKAVKNGIIDLSLSPKPDQYLRQLVECGKFDCRNIKSINISFSDITDPDALLIACNKLFPNLETLDCALNDTDLLLKMALLSKKMENLNGKIHIRYSDDEAELEFSSKFTKRLGYQLENNLSSKSTVINYCLQRVVSADGEELEAAVAQYQAITVLLSKQPEYFKTYCLQADGISMAEKVAGCCELLNNLSAANWKYFTDRSGEIDNNKFIALIKLNDPLLLNMVLEHATLNPNKIDVKELYQAIAACSCDKVLSTLHHKGMLDKMVQGQKLSDAGQNILHIIVRHCIASPPINLSSNQNNLFLNLLELNPNIKLSDSSQHLKMPTDIKRQGEKLKPVKEYISSVREYFKEQAKQDQGLVLRK